MVTNSEQPFSEKLKIMSLRSERITLKYLKEPLSKGSPTISKRHS